MNRTLDTIRKMYLLLIIEFSSTQIDAYVYSINIRDFY